jgi:hypothetical protein
MKVFSQIDVRNGSMEIAVLDLTHLRVAFDQNIAGNIAGSFDWGGMRRIFLDARPGIVDAHSLENRRKMGTFFRKEVVRRLLAGETESAEAGTSVVIVLSGPAFLEEQDPDDPVKPPNNLDHRVFYIRYLSLPAPPMDDLQRTAASLNARVYDAVSNERVREIVASVLDEVSKF